KVAQITCKVSARTGLETHGFGRSTETTEAVTMATLLNPMRTDAIRRRSGLALRNVAPPKRLARATGKSVRLAQAWCSGEKPSPAAICAEFLVCITGAGLKPW